MNDLMPTSMVNGSPLSSAGCLAYHPGEGRSSSARGAGQQPLEHRSRCGNAGKNHGKTMRKAMENGFSYRKMMEIEG